MLLNKDSLILQTTVYIILYQSLKTTFVAKKVYKSHWIDKQNLPEQLVVGFESTSTTLWADSVEV